MAFEDEAKQIGPEFLYLLPGNLRDRSKYIYRKWGITVPYSSFKDQWNTLISQFGMVDTVKKIIKEFIPTLPVKAIDILRKGARDPIPEDEVEALNVWSLVDDNGRTSNLGSFLLKYGLVLSEEYGRLSAVKVYQISACINWLLQVRQSDKVVFEDGSVERYGDRVVLGHLKHLLRLMEESGLGQLEQERLEGLIKNFEIKYRTGNDSLDYLDHPKMLRVLEKIEAVVCQEVNTRDFTELRPISGILDYQKMPSQVLDGLLGDMASSVTGLVRLDLEEAIKCLRFGGPTASVMVGLRAVEGWLRELYYDLVGKETTKGWYDLLKNIQNLLHEKGIAAEPVAGFLNYVRDVRNKADHPDKSFSQVEAEQVFVAATTAIRELEKLIPISKSHKSTKKNTK